jgi:hypothetical protein
MGVHLQNTYFGLWILGQALRSGVAAWHDEQGDKDISTAIALCRLPAQIERCGRKGKTTNTIHFVVAAFSQ